MMSSIFYGKIKEEKLTSWTENKNPNDMRGDLLLVHWTRSAFAIFRGKGAPFANDIGVRFTA